MNRTEFPLYCPNAYVLNLLTASLSKIDFLQHFLTAHVSNFSVEASAGTNSMYMAKETYVGYIMIIAFLHSLVMYTISVSRDGGEIA